MYLVGDRVLKVSKPMLYGLDVMQVQGIVGSKVDGWYGEDTKN